MTTAMGERMTEPILTIRVYEEGDHYIAWWTTDEGVRGDGYRSDVAADAARKALDSILPEATRRRERGRPVNDYWPRRSATRRLTSTRPRSGPAAVSKPAREPLPFKVVS